MDMRMRGAGHGSKRWNALNGDLQRENRHRLQIMDKISQLETRMKICDQQEHDGRHGKLMELSLMPTDTHKQRNYCDLFRLRLLSPYDVLPTGTEFHIHSLSMAVDRPISTTSQQMDLWRSHGEPDWLKRMHIILKVPGEKDGILTFAITWRTVKDVKVCSWASQTSMTPVDITETFKDLKIAPTDTVKRWIPAFKNSFKAFLPDMLKIIDRTKPKYVPT